MYRKSSNNGNKRLSHNAMGGDLLDNGVWNSLYISIHLTSLGIIIIIIIINIR